MSHIHPTVNPCFPRSGHRFLRSICRAYFRQDMAFKSAHSAQNRTIENANYIKDHDFGLLRGTSDIPITDDFQYLVQYRHPLESVQSYFEFRIHHERTADSADSWAEFLPVALDYWKAFVTKWCLEHDRLAGHRVHVVRYGDLYADTTKTVAQVIRFLTRDAEPVDQKRLTQIVARFTGGFARYAADQVKGDQSVKKARDIRDFRYFDDSLYALEDSLSAEFLTPLGIARLLAPQTTP